MSEQSETPEVIPSEAVNDVAEAAEVAVNEDAQADEVEVEEPKKPRGVQKRIDELTLNWRQTERDRDYWRDVAMQTLNNLQAPIDYGFDYDGPTQQQVNQPLSEEALVRRATEIVRAEQAAAEMGAKVENFKATVSDKDTLDFLSSQHAPITQEMADIMLSHEAGVNIAHWLARNQSEAARIARLPPHKQALELITASQKVAAPKAVKTTSASAPPPTLGGRSAPDADPSKMTTDQWMKWRNSQIRG